MDHGLREDMGMIYYCPLMGLCPPALPVTGRHQFSREKSNTEHRRVFMGLELDRSVRISLSFNLFCFICPVVFEFFLPSSLRLFLS